MPHKKLHKFTLDIHATLAIMNNLLRTSLPSQNTGFLHNSSVTTFWLGGLHIGNSLKSFIFSLHEILEFPLFKPKHCI
jgi:hypothetical protein